MGFVEKRNQIIPVVAGSPTTASRTAVRQPVVAGVLAAVGALGLLSDFPAVEEKTIEARVRAFENLQR